MATLFNRTMAMLKTNKEPVSSLSRRANVSQRWLYRLANGDYEDPGVNRIERLHNCLSDHHLNYSERERTAS